MIPENLTHILEVGAVVLLGILMVILGIYTIIGAIVLLANQLSTIPLGYKNSGGNTKIYYKGEKIYETPGFFLLLGGITGGFLLLFILIVILGLIGTALGIPPL